MVSVWVYPVIRLAGPARWAFAALCGAAGLAAVVAAAAPVPTMLVLGDSLSSGYGLDTADQSFPARLEAALTAKGIAVRVINSGVSGDTTAGGLARLDWALADHPNYALVELGANDALRGIRPEEAYRNLDAILTRLQTARVSALLIGMKAPLNWGPEYAAAFNAIYPRLSREHRVLLYPFFLDGVALDPALNQADLLHPNAAGVRVIVARVLPAVKRLIGAVGAR